MSYGSLYVLYHLTAFLKLAYKPPSPSSSAFSESSASKTAPEDVLETSDSADPSGGGFASLADGEGSSGEEDGASGGAFNPVTGEINWDCPCLGGMAHGVCGSQFREAFSCFVFSEEEPKGINCVEKFKHMQDCFREHPDVYGEGALSDLHSMEHRLIQSSLLVEIMDDDDEDETSAPADADASVQAPEVTTPSAETTEVETSEGSLPQAQSA